MKKPIVVFVAGERQHAGKTVTSLGLISALSNLIDPKDIGYFKPVGQEMVYLPNGERIDKDVRIVQEFTELEMPDLGMLSPVRVVDGVTRDYIACDNPKQRTAAYEKAIQQTMDHLSNKRLIIAEGTGHPGVGSVVGLSNARVANLLHARILYLVGGGVGKPLDELEVDLSYFAHKGSHVAGILFNKVIPKKTDMMKEVLNEQAINRIFPEWDPALRVFGYMPQVKYLNNPSMQLISDRFKEKRMFNEKNDLSWRQPCGQVKMITQGSESFIAQEHLNAHDIAVLGSGSHCRLRRIIEFNDSLSGEKMGGIILSCSNNQMPGPKAIAMIEQSGIPTIAVPEDAGTIDQHLFKAFKNTKLQLYDRQKHAAIKQLFSEHFDAERFIRTLGL